MSEGGVLCQEPNIRAKKGNALESIEKTMVAKLIEAVQVVQRFKSAPSRAFDKLFL